MGDLAGSEVTQQLMGAETSGLEIGPIGVAKTFVISKQYHGHLLDSSEPALSLGLIELWNMDR